MPTLSQRRQGLLFGSFTADALSLGVHWIYDTNELSKKFGYVERYYAPGSDSYHPNKQAGDQSHVGDQALRLAAYLKSSDVWKADAFMQVWTTMWPEYDDYFDHATKTILQNIESGKALTEAACESTELAGAARIAPLLACMSDQSEATVVKACTEQTLLTHASDKSKEAATFLSQAGYRLIQGASLEATLHETAPKWALNKAEAVLELDAVEAIAQLGQSCPIDAALPAVIYLCQKYSDNLPKAFSENAMAGGDNCARGLALGLLLGAAHGIDAIPSEWVTDLKAAPLLQDMLN